MHLTLLMMNEYWKRYDELFDYLWMDYFWAYLKLHFPYVNNMFECIEANNLSCLNLNLSEEYTGAEKIPTNEKNTWFYKLSYKFSNSIPLYNNQGKATILGRIITS